MKKLSYIAIAMIGLSACGGGGTSVEELLEIGDVEALKAKKTELAANIRDMQSTISQIEENLDKHNGIKKLPLVTAYKVEEQVFKHYVEVQGTVSTDQDIVIYPELQGILKSVKVKMGDVVRAGETLAIIDDGGINEQLVQVKEQLKLAKLTYERQKRLWEQEIGSEIDFLRTETNYLSLVASVEQLEKTKAKSVIVAPYSGVIDDVTAELGQLMVPGQTPVLRIVNLDDMYIRADLPEVYLSNVTVSKEVVVNIPVLKEEVEAKVSKVGSYINPNNRTFLVEVAIENKDRKIKPNLTARLKINDYINDKALLVPQSIISEDSEGKQYVYRINAENTVQKVNIVTGKKNDEFIEVLSGLNNRDALVEEGARIVKEGQEVNIIN